MVECELYSYYIVDPKTGVIHIGINLTKIHLYLIQICENYV